MSLTLLELASSYYQKGKLCISDGKLLFENPDSSGAHGILLIQGIELLLSSFLFLQDKSISKEHDIYHRYKHNLRIIYDRCREVDKKRVLAGFQATFLGIRYFQSSIEARYPKTFRSMEVDANIYEIIETDLIPRIELLLQEQLGPGVDPLIIPDFDTWIYQAGQDEPIFENEFNPEEYD